MHFNVDPDVKRRVSLKRLEKLTTRFNAPNGSLALMNYLNLRSEASIRLEALDFCSFPPPIVIHSFGITSVYLRFEPKRTEILLSGPRGRLHAEGQDERFQLIRESPPEKDRIWRFLEHFDLGRVGTLGVTVDMSTAVGLLDILCGMKGVTTLFLNQWESIECMDVIHEVIGGGLCRDLVVYMKEDSIKEWNVLDMERHGCGRKLNSVVVLTDGFVYYEGLPVVRYAEAISSNSAVRRVPGRPSRWDHIPSIAQSIYT